MKMFFESDPCIFSKGGGIPSLKEDTIANFHYAVDLGADVISTNAALTGDNKLILVSDRALKENGFAEGYALQRSADEIRESYSNTIEGDEEAGASALFPELADVLEEFPGHRFNIALFDKNPSTSKELCSVVMKTASGGRILASSYSSIHLTAIAKEVPEMAVSFSLAELVRYYALFRSGLLYFRNKFKRDALVMPETIGTSRIANQGLISSAASRGLKTYVLYPDEKRLKRHYGAGVDGFITNDINLIKNLYKDI